MIIIILIGFLQDRLFVYLDKRLFPHKYHKTILTGVKEIKYGIYVILGMMTLAIFQSLYLPGFSETMSSIAAITVIAAILMIGYGEYQVQANLNK